jgi:hypothetical protein
VLTAINSLSFSISVIFGPGDFWFKVLFTFLRNLSNQWQIVLNGLNRKLLRLKSRNVFPCGRLIGLRDILLPNNFISRSMPSKTFFRVRRVTISLLVMESASISVWIFHAW